MTVPWRKIVNIYLHAGLLCLAMLQCPLAARAQDMLGAAASNYAGIVGLDLQPASIVDSRLRFDIGMGLNANFASNYLGFRADRLTKISLPGNSFYSNNGGVSVFAAQNTEGGSKAIFMNASVMGPSFMLALDAKSAIAFSSRIRLVFNTDNVDPRFMQLALNRFDVPSLRGQTIGTDGFNGQYAQFNEYGLTYGRVVLDRGKHFVKAAARLKFLQGVGSFYFLANTLQLTYFDQTRIVLNPSNMRYAYSNGFNEGFQPFAQRATSVGGDFGVVYEYRPKYKEGNYDMDGELSLPDASLNKYKLRVGFSMIDIGSLTFQRGSPSDNLVNAQPFVWDITNVPFNSFRGITDTLHNRFGRGPASNIDNSYTINLPTSASLQIDYRLRRNLFLNFTTYNTFKIGQNGTRAIGTYMFTPRFESQLFDVFLPISLNAFNDFNLGVAARLGEFPSLVIGSNSLLGAFAFKANDFRTADFYMALKFSLYRTKPGDKDKDKVSNGKDKCPDVYGTWEFQGCPDTDGDHIPDDKDACPEQPGLPRHTGCPDTDGDDVPDKLDLCPNDPGLKENKGCPANPANTDPR
jgi:hypothetical protein